MATTQTLEAHHGPVGGAAQFDHLALNLPEEDALHDLRRRLKSADYDVTNIIDHGAVRA